MARTYLSFVSLSEIVGTEDATALCQHFGGLPLYVAKDPERSKLVSIIGHVAAESLCAAFGGEEIMLPLGPHRRPPLKERIVAMLEAGVSHSAIARELRCTTRYVEMLSRDLGFGKPKVQKPKVQKPKRKVVKQEILELLRNNTERLSVKKIAERFCVTAGYIYSLRAEHGIPPYRKRQEADTGAASKA